MGQELSATHWQAGRVGSGLPAARLGLWQPESKSESFCRAAHDLGHSNSVTSLATIWKVHLQVAQLVTCNNG